MRCRLEKGRLAPRTFADNERRFDFGRNIEVGRLGPAFSYDGKLQASSVIDGPASSPVASMMLRSPVFSQPVSATRSRFSMPFEPRSVWTCVDISQLPDAPTKPIETPDTCGSQ